MPMARLLGNYLQVPPGWVNHVPQLRCIYIRNANVWLKECVGFTHTL